jgi:purine-cytosine permease-like protein
MGLLLIFHQIVSRYLVGFNPSKVCCVLNVLTNLGYGMMSSMVGGQLLSKLTGGAVSVVVGIIIVALLSLVVATFGMHIFQYYERQVRHSLKFRKSYP